MLEKLEEQISKIDKISKYILKYGLLACLIVFVITRFVMNEADSVYDVFIAHEIAGTGFNMLIEVVIGAILFDICIKNR